eukprot:1196236-Prorocentrum_minimum.AAC.6
MRRPSFTRLHRQIQQMLEEERAAERAAPPAPARISEERGAERAHRRRGSKRQSESAVQPKVLSGERGPRMSGPSGPVKETPADNQESSPDIKPEEKSADDAASAPSTRSKSEEKQADSPAPSPSAPEEKSADDAASTPCPTKAKEQSRPTTPSTPICV